MICVYIQYTTRRVHLWQIHFFGPECPFKSLVHFWYFLGLKGCLLELAGSSLLLDELHLWCGHAEMQWLVSGIVSLHSPGGTTMQWHVSWIIVSSRSPGGSTMQWHVSGIVSSHSPGGSTMQWHVSGSSSRHVHQVAAPCRDMFLGWSCHHVHQVAAPCSDMSLGSSSRHVYQVAAPCNVQCSIHLQSICVYTVDFEKMTFCRCRCSTSFGSGRPSRFGKIMSGRRKFRMRRELWRKICSFSIQWVSWNITWNQCRHHVITISDLQWRHLDFGLQ